MDLQPYVGATFRRLADQLESTDVWDRPSLCEGWQVRHLAAHVTMAARMDEQQFGAEMAAAGGDFQRLSDTVALRDGALPVEEHLANLRSDTLAAWQPPGGGAIGALNHSVVHSLDVTNAVGLDRSCSDDAARAILDNLTQDNGAQNFDVAIDDLALDATDLEWTWGSGANRVGASAADLISLLCNRTLVDGTRLRH